MTTRRLRTIARPTLLVTAALLAGCGQRGDLYLPTPQKTAVPVDAARPAECVGQGGDAARDPAAATGCAAPAK
jgi:predicted small lipoprotein YifL